MNSKYQDALTEKLYNRYLNGATDEEIGSVDELGWFGLFRNMRGGHIIMQDIFGNVYRESFRSTKKLEERWSYINYDYERYDGRQ